MSKPKIMIISFSMLIILTAFAMPVFAIDYNPGVSTGQYVKYGNFVGTGPGVESFNDYDWQKTQVISASGKEVTLLFTGQFKDGTPTPGNGSTTVWNIEAGTEDGTSSTQGPIIAANLNQGDAIPPPNTFTINTTETRTYLGVSRSVNILNVVIITPGYNTTLDFVYDKASGMLLESKSETIAQAQPEPITSTFSYIITETNIFNSISPTSTPLATTTPSIAPTPSTTIPEFPASIIVLATLLILATTIGIIFLIKKQSKQSAKKT